MKWAPPFVLGVVVGFWVIPWLLRVHAERK